MSVYMRYSNIFNVQERLHTLDLSFSMSFFDIFNASRMHLLAFSLLIQRIIGFLMSCAFTLISSKEKRVLAYTKKRTDCPDSKGGLTCFNPLPNFLVLSAKDIIG